MRSRRTVNRGFRGPIDPYAINDLNETEAKDARFYDRVGNKTSQNSYHAQETESNTNETFGWNGTGSNEDNKYSQNGVSGSSQGEDASGSLNNQNQFFDPSQQSCSGQDQSYGQSQQYYGSQSQSYGQNQQYYGGQNQPYGNRQYYQSYGQNQQYYGGQNQSYGQNQQYYGGQSRFYGQNQQYYGGQSQFSGQNQQSQESFGQDQQYYNSRNQNSYAGQQSYADEKNQTYGGQQSGTASQSAGTAGRNSRSSAGSTKRSSERSSSQVTGRTARNRKTDKKTYKDSIRKNTDGGKGRGDGHHFHPVLLIVLLIIIITGTFGLYLYQQKYSYSKEQADVNAYFNITDESDVPIIWNNELSDIRAKLIDGTVYLDISSVKSNLNDRFYYGVQNSSDETGMVLYSLPTQTVKTVVGSSEVQTSDGTQTMDYIPAVRDGDTIYLALPFIQQYTNFKVQQFDSPTRLVITTDYSDITTATLNRDTAIRTSGGIKSPILENLSKGDTVTVLEQMDTWSRVVSSDGFIGYIENKRLDNLTQTQQSAATNYTEPEYTTHQLGEKVNMAFHNVYSTEAANDTLESYMAKTQTVNVIAPTIFWVTNEQGDISSFASQYYVDTAHNMGLKVWAVVDNINSTKLSDKSSFLATEDSRQNLISQLMDQVQTYGYDGINVDFELIEEQYGDDYIQFIRELSIACRNAGLTLSVDGYPNYEFNSYYHLQEQGIFVDYCVIMGYDEHYAGDTQAGSVASINYVTEGLKMACEKVDPSKIINAVPFYSRIWTTSPDGTVTSEAYGLQDIQDYITEHGMTQTWSAADGQNYAEMTDESGNKIQIWVEDEQSIKLKLDAMTACGIAGVAEWKLDFDTEEIWNVIADYMNQ